jgi:Glyoxalase-like domain
MQLDHVIIAASASRPDAPRLPSAYGLDATPGGRHPEWGTANWIVPLGASYLELIAVADEREAQRNDFGRRILDASEGDLVGWAVRPDDIEATAARLGLRVGEGSRTRPSGERVEWRMAGLQEAMERPWLPFFVEWRDPAVFPGATAAPSPHVTRLELACDIDELSAWLGPHSLPLELRSGVEGVTAVVLDGPRGTITLGRPPAR